MKITIIMAEMKIIIDTESGSVETEKKTITPGQRETALKAIRIKPAKHCPVAKPNGAVSSKILEALSGRNVSPCGASVEQIKSMTGLTGKRTVANALYKLHKAGLVETVRRGMYVKL